ncbi:hypothetical protein L202_00756 [Cryptococcus amylolentus CBS 6039]|uniref:Uncharacterized protein n=1 Tax=Cryptococcus amylolentus CBS 6039 TaxID=1295533 RepID=A0A1E3I943_9TREE|nr:hypothetical protein L202_00756 [Cryptococcus amylolentus CBS 6039]ODN84905.1 hypothetical protein L202_00756 [Cryptococcus amylolentus CBS 6039]
MPDSRIYDYDGHITPQTSAALQEAASKAILQATGARIAITITPLIHPHVIVQGFPLAVIRFEVGKFSPWTAQEIGVVDEVFRVVGRGRIVGEEGVRLQLVNAQSLATARARNLATPYHHSAQAVDSRPPRRSLRRRVQILAGRGAAAMEPSAPMRPGTPHPDGKRKR